jgi:hypothetical protein
MILWIGLYPAPFLRMMNGSVQALVDRLDHGTLAGAETEQPRAGGARTGVTSMTASHESAGEPLAARLQPRAMDRE